MIDGRLDLEHQGAIATGFAGTILPNDLFTDEEKSARFDAVDRAVAVLRVLERSDQPMSLSMIAREVGLGQPTTSRYVASLVGHGLIEKVNGNRYVLGIGLYILGQKSLHRRDVRTVAHPYLETLHEQFNETVSFALWLRREVVVVDCIEAMQTLRQGASVGVVNPWHATSLGKSILAWLDPHEVDVLLKEPGLPRYTYNTLTTVDQLRAEFPLIRERGYSVDNEESAIGGRCIGAPVFDQSGRPLGAISISGPVARVTDEDVPSTGGRIAEIAGQISRAMGYSGRPSRETRQS